MLEEMLEVVLRIRVTPKMKNDLEEVARSLTVFHGGKPNISEAARRCLQKGIETYGRGLHQ